MVVVYQIYVTDNYGTHSSRSNLGIFSLPSDGLFSLLDNLELLKNIFIGETRLFIEKCDIDKVDGYSQIFDTANENDMNTLKQIVFFKTIENVKADLGFLTLDTDELEFDINAIESYRDVPIETIHEFMNIDNVENFIDENLVE